MLTYTETDASVTVYTKSIVVVADFSTIEGLELARKAIEYLVSMQKYLKFNQKDESDDDVRISFVENRVKFADQDDQLDTLAACLVSKDKSTAFGILKESISRDSKGSLAVLQERSGSCGTEKKSRDIVSLLGILPGKPDIIVNGRVS